MRASIVKRLIGGLEKLMAKIKLFTTILFLAIIAYPHEKMKDPMPANAMSWQYHIVAQEGARELEITATFPPGTAKNFGMEGRKFARDVEIAEGDKWRPMPREKGGWLAPDSIRQGLRIRYRFLL